MMSVGQVRWSSYVVKYDGPVVWSCWVFQVWWSCLVVMSDGHVVWSCRVVMLVVKSDRPV